ncbi:hypothetical protein C2E23DRAFT_711878, partial [Lenzites betulinus]
LNDSNYAEWSIQMRAILVRKGIWEVVSGTATRPLGSPNSKTEVHASAGLGSRITLRTEFYRQRMEAPQAIQAYVAQVRKSAFRLEQAGASISDEERLGVLLAGLPSRFGPFIVSLEALPESDRTFSSVVRRLVNEDAR